MVAFPNSRGQVTKRLSVGADGQASISVGTVEAEAAWRAASLVCIERRLQMVQERVAGGTLSDEALALARASLGLLLERLDEPCMQRALPQAKGLGKD